MTLFVGLVKYEDCSGEPPLQLMVRLGGWEFGGSENRLDVDESSWFLSGVVCNLVAWGSKLTIEWVAGELHSVPFLWWGGLCNVMFLKLKSGFARSLGWLLMGSIIALSVSVASIESAFSGASGCSGDFAMGLCSHSVFLRGSRISFSALE